MRRTNNVKFLTKFDLASIFPKEIGNVLLYFSRWFALLLLFIFLSFICRPYFFSIRNIINILRQASLLYIISIGVTLTILSKGIDLSIGGVLAFSSCIAASFLKQRIPMCVGILVGLGLGSLCGLANGAIVALIKVHPFIATYAMMWISRGIAYVYMKGNIIFGFSPEFRFLGGGRILGIPTPIMFAGFIFLIFYFLSYHTKLGKAIYGVGANMEAARLLGVNVNKTLIITYGLSGLLAGVGGLLYISRLNAAEPAIGELFMLETIAATILGGTPFRGGEGGIINTISGVLMITLTINGMNMLGVSIFWQQFVLGTVVVMGILANQYIGRLLYVSQR